LHSHDFREASEFKGKTVCLVGSGYSAEDICMQMLKYGAKRCIITYRTNPSNIVNLKDNLSHKKLFQKIEGSKLIFEDGDEEEVDALILCTGYNHNFPFYPRI